MEKVPISSSNVPATVFADKAKVVKARSVPSPHPFRVAVFFSSIHFLVLITTTTALVCFLLTPSHLASIYLAGGLVSSGITWLISFFQRRAVHCPLCKGTPLIQGGARPHHRAMRLRPLNCGLSAVLSILATQKFRCMYCGSEFDLLKPRNRQQGAGHLKIQSSDEARS